MRKSRKRLALSSAAALSLAIVSPPARGFDSHFDYTSFDNPNTPTANPHFGANQFAALNYPSINGNYMMTSTDTHRPEMLAAGNNLAEFYNNFLADYNTQYNSNPTHTLDGFAEADKINAYAVSNSTHNGPKPNWVILNEISTSVWQDTTQKGIDYRNTYVINAVTKLHDTYGFNVVTYSPFATVGTSRAAEWQAIAAKSYIGVENYLSGAEVMAGGSDYATRLAWAQGQYQASVDTYGAAGVDETRLFLGEHFGNTAAGNGFGRAGISASDWDNVIQIRQDAIRSVGFPGFLAYSWGSNGMAVSEAEMIQHEYYYRSRLVLPSQQPQWLADDAYVVNGTPYTLTWGEPLNWIGGVPDSVGAVANFYRTNTAPRSITLDGPRTVGTLSFNSASSYTILPGSGGGITMDNGGASPATITLITGSHTIAAPLTIADDTTIDIQPAASTLTLAADQNVTGSASLTKIGAGTLTVKNIHAGALALSAGKIVVAPLGESGGVSRVASVSVVAPATLDLKDNDLVSSSATPVGTWNGSAYTGMTGLVAAGRITTSSPTSGLTQLGIATASQVKNIAAGATALWNGQTVTGSDTLVMYTYGGDANLDGKINVDDYGRIDQSIPLGLSGWYNGDFNYDGKINVDDYGIIDSNTGIQGAPFPASAGWPTSVGLSSAVPEPLLTLAPTALLLPLRTRRRKIS